MSMGYTDSNGPPSKNITSKHTFSYQPRVNIVDPVIR